MRKLALAAAAAGIVIGSAGVTLARDMDRGMSESAPGQEMHERGSVPGSPGASGYTRGHLYNRSDSDHDSDRDRTMTRHHGDRDFDRDGMTRHHGDRDLGGDRDIK